MKMLFKQRLISWLDSYDIYNEFSFKKYTVKGKIGFGHKLHILDSDGIHIATLKQDILSFLPKFNMYINDKFVGSINKKFTFFKPSFKIDYKDWKIIGNIFELDYAIIDSYGENVAIISKEFFNFTDTYSIEVKNDDDAIYVLMVTLAIDAEKCSRN